MELAWGANRVVAVRKMHGRSKAHIAPFALFVRNARNRWPSAVGFLIKRFIEPYMRSGTLTRRWQLVHVWANQPPAAQTSGLRKIAIFAS